MLGHMKSASSRVRVPDPTPLFWATKAASTALGEAVSDFSIRTMAPVGAEMRRLMADTAEIDRVLRDGAERAAAIADPVVDEVKKIVGFWRG